MTAATAPTTRYRLNLPTGTRTERRIGSSIGDFVPLAVVVLQHRDGQDEQEEDHGFRRGVAEVVPLECLPVEVQDDDVGGAGRPAPRQDEDLVEDLERQDGVVDQYEGGGGSEERDRDVAEAPQGTGPVDGRGLVELWRDGLEPRQVDDHVIPQVLPDTEDDDRSEGHVAGHQPGLLREADELEQHVEDAELRVVHPPPDHGRGDGAGDHGREVHGFEEFLQVKLGVEHDRQDQPQEGRDGHDGDDVGQRVDGRSPKNVISEQGVEVLQADEGEPVLEQFHLVKAIEEGLHRRQDAEEPEEDDDRSDEEVGVEDMAGVKLRQDLPG